jgi:hypothetical protein
MNQKPDENRWLELLESLDRVVAEILTQLDGIQAGRVAPAHAADISRSLFMVAEVFPRLTANAARQVALLDRSCNQPAFASAILTTIGRIKNSMEQINWKLHGLQASGSLHGALIPPVLN